jgi:hypothetical protein
LEGSAGAATSVDASGLPAAAALSAPGVSLRTAP